MSDTRPIEPGEIVVHRSGILEEYLVCLCPICGTYRYILHIRPCRIIRCNSCSHMMIVKFTKDLECRFCRRRLFCLGGDDISKKLLSKIQLRPVDASIFSDWVAKYQPDRLKRFREMSH